LKDRKLVINKSEAAIVRAVFEGFIKTGSTTVLVRSLREQGVRAKRGRLIDKGYVYQLLKNRVYIGEAVHKGTSYPGEHQPIITRALWDKERCVWRRRPAADCRRRYEA